MYYRNYVCGYIMYDDAGGDDYGQTGVADPQTFTTTIPSGSRQGSISVPIIDDNVLENEEQFMLTLQSPQQCNVVLTSQQSTNVTIVDNDGKMVITVL